MPPILNRGAYHQAAANCQGYNPMLDVLVLVLGAKRSPRCAVGPGFFEDEDEDEDEDEAVA